MPRGGWLGSGKRPPGVLPSLHPRHSPTFTHTKRYWGGDSQQQDISPLEHGSLSAIGARPGSGMG